MNDLDHITYMAREAHSESRLSYINFSEAKVARIVERALSDPKGHGIFLAFRNLEPVGLAYCSVGECHIGTGSLLATIHNIDVRYDARANIGGGCVFLGLLKGAETWGRARGASEILFRHTSGVNVASLKGLLKRISSIEIGGSYA